MLTCMVLAFLLLTGLQPVYAQPAAGGQSTITCHCYQDRMFDTKAPGVADDFYLTTTHNAFYAQAGEASKKIIVRARQRGLSGDDLWIAFALSQNSGQNQGQTIKLEQLVTTRLQNSDWDSTLKQSGIDPTTLEHELQRALQGKSSRAVTETVDQALVKRQLITPTQLAELRALNATNKEVLASVLLQIYGKGSAVEYLRQVRSGAHWDALMHQAGIDIAQVEQLWAYSFTKTSEA
ncbi:MAG: hypothetical protein PHH87_08120 [Desulfuromonas sp.]|nr:hypothetical protein [Desulfuromonas sp.]